MLRYRFTFLRMVIHNLFFFSKLRVAQVGFNFPAKTIMVSFFVQPIF